MSTREVILDGGSPWGFRMHGGADVQQPLRISRVNPGSKAAQRGIREGDFISSINGQTTRDISNSEAHSLLRNAGNTLTLGLNQENLGSPKRRTQKLSQEAKEDLFKRSSITSTSSSTFSNISTINRILTNSSQSNEALHTNGIHKHTAEEKYSHPASDYSSYVKNGSTSSRGDNTDVNVHQLGDNAAADLITIMADNSGSSRSRRQRRSRNKKSKNKQTPPCIPTVIVENPIQEDDANSATASSFVDKPEVLVTNCDKVESVKQVNEEIKIELISEQENTVNLNQKQINSVNITSLNNVSKIENSVECNPENEASIVIFKPDKTPEETTSNIEPVEKRKSKRNKKRNTKFSDEPKETGLETDTVQIENISSSTYEEESKNNVEQVEIIKVDRITPKNVKTSLEDTAQSNKINEGITVEEIQAVPETNTTDDLNNEENVIQSEIKIKKKRSRKESKRTKTSESESTLIESTEVVSNTIISEENAVKKNIKNVPKPQEIIRVPYRVESPKTVIEEEKKSSSMVKSRSLDDDDLVKITEITEDTTQSKTSESTAIVSEAESDVEWETVSDLDEENSTQHFGKLSVISLPLEEHRTFEPSNLSPEDERGLRDFLQGLDLVSSPEESVKRIDKPSTSSSTSESTKTRKAKKRAALIQHFMPYYQNPRFLDVISEEGSDLSDKDCRKESIRRAIPPVEDDDDDVFEDYAKEKKMRERYQENMSQFRPILVDTKLIDSCKHTVDATWSTAMAETQKGAELVYLEDSSNSMTPSDLLDLDETVDADDEDEISLELDKSFSDSYDVSLNKNDPPIISSSDTLRESLFDTTEQIPSEVTAPSLTPVNNSTANDTDFAPDITKPSNPSSIDLVPLKDSAVVETSEKQDANNTNVYKINENFIKTNIIDFINTILDESVKQVENNDSETIELNNQITTENVINSPDEIQLANSQNTVIQEIKSEQQDAETLIENDEELNKELKNLCDSLRQKTGDEYSSRSESVNSACSSRSTSQSTTIYNPAHSSLTNIATMLREGSAENKEPNTLRELCVHQLLSMPFGKDVIEELANVSKSIEEMIYHTPFPLSISNNTKSSRNNQTHPSSVLLVKPQKDTEKWVQSTMDTEKLIESLTQFEKCTKKSGDISKENWKETPIEKQTPNYIKWSQNNTKKSPQVMNESENIRIIPIQIESTEPKQKSGIVRIIPIEIEPRPENKSTTPKNKTVKETENWVKIPIKIDSRTQKEIDLDVKPKIENKNTKEIPIKIEKKTNAQEELEKWKQHVKENTKEFEKLLHNSKTTNSQKTTENWTTCTTKTEKLIQNTAKKSEKWIGMPTEVDPKLLVCLSPAQKDFIDKTKTVPKEADSLLDLHKKFIERRGYNDKYESFSKTISKEPPTFQVKLQPTTSQNNLLKIIKDSSETNKEQSAEDYLKYFSRELRTPTPVPRGVNEHKNIRYNEYIKQLTQEVPIQVERTINKPVNNKIYTAALLDNENNRLNARHLGEWLNLARNTCDLTKSKLVTQQSYDTGIKQPEFTKSKSPRRYSLPFNLYEKQMQYILEKEREIEREIEKLRVEKDILEKMEKVEKIEESKLNDLDVMNLEEKLNKMDLENRSNKKELHTTTILEEIEKLQTSNLTERPMKSEIFHKADNVPLQSDSEKFRQEMYNEYMSKIAERQERKENKVIKIKISTPKPDSGPSELSPQCELKLVAGIEDEFMSRVKERMDKLGLHESSDEDKTKEDETASILIMDGSSIKDTKKLPKHIQEFVDLTRNESGPWTPAKSAGDDTNETVTTDSKSKSTEKKQSPPPAPKEQPSDEPIPVVWTPRSAGSSPTAERKEFRPVNFESPVLSRKNKSKDSTPATTPDASVTSVPPPWIPGQGSGTVLTESSSSQTIETSSTLTTSTSSLERRLTTSQSAPVAGLNNLSKLPRAQNPTITLLQKAREGQLPRGASYIEQQIPQPSHRSKDDRLPGIIGSNEILYTVKNEYMSESDSEKPKKMANLGPRKFEGIGPTTKDGMPIVLRSEVKDVNQAKWYKQMYDTLHRAKNDDEYVTVRYKTRRGRYPYASAGGYLSEPEPMAYDSDAGISASKYATLDRRRLQQNRDKENEYITYTVPRNKYMSASVKHSTDIYKNQPGRIENYVTGHSSISDKEAKEWWDEVMEIFDGHLEQQKHVPPQTKSYMSHALKESGYESDSTLVFRRREDAALQLNPHEQKEAYKTIQKGGEVPLHGLRKLAPERPKESPRKYVEDEVTIHYRSPVRHEIKEMISEEELARKQAEAMRRIYQEERRRKYLQELQDMNSRRHTDNFIPSQKSPISLNRYDDFIDDLSLKLLKPRDQSPEPRLVARALYNFVGQSSRELTFRKGDVIFIRRQVDKNWYEGEHNAMIGLFPSNYVEIVPYDGIKSTPRKAHEGQARAKFNFIAQTHLELSLAKGELVVLTRRIDDNWFEGRIGTRKGIFPVSYVEILIDPSEKQEAIVSSKPVASPAAHSLLLNGSSGGKESMGSHHYQPSYSPQQQRTSFHAKPVNVIGTSTSLHSLSRATQKLSTPAVNEALHIDTHSEPVPYRALYKYKPQNDDELELLEGDTVYVLEKCDDGWYVGSSQRTGAFGTFPGNYVERI